MRLAAGAGELRVRYEYKRLFKAKEFVLPADERPAKKGKLHPFVLKCSVRKEEWHGASTIVRFCAHKSHTTL